MPERLRIALLVIGSVALVAIDMMVGDVGTGSWLFTVLQILAAIPWAVLVLRRARGTTFQAILVNLVFVVLLFGALFLKVLLLASPLRGATPEQLTNVYRTYGAMAGFVAALGFAGRGQRTVWFFNRVAEHPARMLITSAAVASTLGAFLLATPFAQADPRNAVFIDALFDATGALCGALSVSDVGRQYLFFGQLVILLLMQLGGFGIMVLSASIFILAGRRLEVKSSVRLAEVVDADSLADLRGTVRGIILWTLAIEAMGALLLFFLFDGRPGIGAHPEDTHPLAGGGGALWSAIFLSVSSFANAGFSPFRGSLAPFVGDVPVMAVISSLIVLGGLGFPVLSELGRQGIELVLRRPRRRLSLHARVVLVATAMLIVLGAVPLLVLEWNRSFAELRGADKELAALFQSITARTAGFGSVDFARMSAPSLCVMSALMFIGAAPGSTGGGIKVTTLAVLIATFRAEQSSSPAPTLFRREIPAGVQRKAIVVTFLSALLVSISVFLVLCFEDQPPLFVLFEATSAFGSVGCSTGIEAKMTVAGKVIIIATMVIGRVGPLTFALAATEKPKSTVYRNPEEKVMIG